MSSATLDGFLLCAHSEGNFWRSRHVNRARLPVSSKERRGLIIMLMQTKSTEDIDRISSETVDFFWLCANLTWSSFQAISEKPTEISVCRFKQLFENSCFSQLWTRVEETRLQNEFRELERCFFFMPFFQGTRQDNILCLPVSSKRGRSLITKRFGENPLKRFQNFGHFWSAWFGTITNC